MQTEQKRIMRDAVIFAVKLWIDSLKDIILAFAGLAAAAVDVLQAREQRDQYLFYKVMRTAQKVDHALDLYGTSHPEEPISKGN